VKTNKSDFITVSNRSIVSLEPIRELFQHLDLLFTLAQRDIKVRYKQTVLGIIWVILQPLVVMIIFTIFFGRIAKIPTLGIPYNLFVLIGIIYWNLFSSSLSHISNSLVDNEQILKKVYIPRLIIPISSLGVSLVDFAICFLLFLAISIFYGITPPVIFLLFTIISVILVLFSSIGFGLLLSSLNVKYRDVRYALPFFFQLLLFVSPVIYPTTIVSPANRLILALNPISIIIEVNRFALSNQIHIDLSMLVVSALFTFAGLISGYYYFFKTQRQFADII